MGIALRSRPVRLAATLLIVTPLTAASLALLAGSAGAQEGGATVEAVIENQFKPAEITIAPGGSVTWVNKGGAHTVTGGAVGAIDATSPIGDNQLFDPEAKVTKTFDKEGTYDYFCQPHGALGMKGVVIVKAGAAAGTGSATPAAGATSSSTPPASSGAAASSSPAATSSSPAAAASVSATAAPAGPATSEAEEKALTTLDAKMAKEGKTLDKFRLGLWAMTGLMIALGAGVYLATRSTPDRA